MNLSNVADVVYSFTQELETGRYAQLSAGDEFGAAIALGSGLLLASAPGHDERWSNLEIKTSAIGKIYTFNNLTNTPSWALTRNQLPQVDIDSINRTFIYNKSNNNLIAPLDIIDPAKGKILSGVASDINYRLDHDPAAYNAGTKQFTGSLVGNATTSSKFLDPKYINGVAFDCSANIALSTI
jgi:hypothetical protein